MSAGKAYIFKKTWIHLVVAKVYTMFTTFFKAVSAEHLGTPHKAVNFIKKAINVSVVRLHTTCRCSALVANHTYTYPYPFAEMFCH